MILFDKQMDQDVIKYIDDVTAAGGEFRRLYGDPVESDIILFDSFRGKMPYGNAFYILKAVALNKRYDNFRIFWSAIEPKVEAFEEMLVSYGLEQRASIVVYNSLQHAQLLARAKYLVVDFALPSYYIKKEGQMIWQVWHGVGPKAMGRFELGLPLNTDAFYTLCSADFFTIPSVEYANYLLDAYASRPYMDKTKLIYAGFPRNDAFVASGVEGIKAKLGASRLYAFYPTWRINTQESHIARNRQYEELFNKLDSLLNEDEKMLVKFHPSDPLEMDFSEYLHIIPIVKGVEHYELLAACDCIISDYSSVMFDVAQAGKKVVCYAYDEEEYTETRGFYMDISKLPFPVVRDIDSLLFELRSEKRYICTPKMLGMIEHRYTNTAELLSAHVLLNEKHFEEQSVNGICIPSVLVCPGKTAIKRGADYLAEMSYANTVQSKPAALFIRENQAFYYPSMINNLPQDIPLMAGDRSLLTPAFSEEILAGRPVKLMRALCAPANLNYWKMTAKKISNTGSCLDKVICDIDADINTVMTFAYMSCKRVLRATEEALNKCNYVFIAYAAQFYDEILADSEQTVYTLKGIVGEKQCITVR